MRKITSRQAIVSFELQQLTVDLWREIDLNGGADAADYFTEECFLEVGAFNFSGREAARRFFSQRRDTMQKNQKDGVRTTRHSCLNMQVDVASERLATINFMVCTFGGEGRSPIVGVPLSINVSDGTFECERGDDGCWRIARYTGEPVFVSSDPFAQKAILGEASA